MLQWISATVAVLVLIVVVGRAAGWLLGRTLERSSRAAQLAAWRVAPDASVRAVRVLGRVHLLYERGRESTLIESLEPEDYQARCDAEAPTGGGVRGLRLLGGRSRDERHVVGD